MFHPGDEQRTLLLFPRRWRGHNESSQYRGSLVYPSLFGNNESILIEAGQCEGVMPAVESVPLKTMLLDSLFGGPVLPEFDIRALSKAEAYAEKVHAALTREPPAIRNLYDFWPGLRAEIIPVDDVGWAGLVRRKCLGLELAQCCSDERRDFLRRELETDLRPVLRARWTDSRLTRHGIRFGGYTSDSWSDVPKSAF